MKILFYAHQFPPAKGGIPYSNYEIAKGLHNLGHEVHVIACRNAASVRFLNGIEFPVYLLPKWPFAPMPCLNGLGLLNWIFLPVYFLTILNKIKQIGPDAVFVLDETSNCFWGIWAKFVKKPYVSYCSVPFSRYHAGKPKRISVVKKFLSKRAIFSYLFKMSYTNARSVICVSTSTKSEIVKMIPGIESRLVVIGRSIDDIFFKTPVKKTQDRKNRARLKRKFTLLSVSRLAKDKGIDDVIRSIATFNKANLKEFKYIIVGEGDAEASLKELVKFYKLEPIIHFAGGVSHDQLIPYYDACDLFILPSRRGISESFGRVFVEAAARYKPSIAVNDGGMVDIIEDGINGFLVSSGDISTIKQKIMYLIENTEAKIQMGVNARAKAENSFTSRKISEKIDRQIARSINRVRVRIA